jgi:hypothetical protein
MQTSLPTPTQDNVRWMCWLHSLAREWVNSIGSGNEASRTEAYVDLTFAFTLARIGANEASEICSRQAIGQISGLDDAHLILQQMYGYRIAQARQGQEHRGPFPNEILEYLERMERFFQYNVDALRYHSRILEPDQRTNPYRHWGERVSEFQRDLAALSDLTDHNDLAARLNKLFAEPPKGVNANEHRVQVLRAGLEVAPRVGEEFARTVIARAVPTYDALPKARDLAALGEQAQFLEKAMFVARYYRLVDFVDPLLDRVRTQVSGLNLMGLYMLSPAIRECIHSLIILRMGDELDSFLGEIAGLVPLGELLRQLASDGELTAHGPIPYALLVMLCVAEGWYGFGWDRLAEPVTQKAWALLLSGSLCFRTQTQLACAYAECIGKASGVDRGRLEDIFHHVKGIRDTYTSSTDFNVSPLEVVESVALAAVEVCRHS